MQTIALVGASLDRFATEIRNLQRTDVLEVEEGFTKGQKGSSAMPHKRNPIRSERVSGLARILRSYVLTALENVPLWHERDISHSSNERIMLPDVSICLHFMLREMKDIERDNEIMDLIDQSDLEECFNPSIHLNNLSVIWEKLGI